MHTNFKLYENCMYNVSLKHNWIIMIFREIQKVLLNTKQILNFPKTENIIFQNFNQYKDIVWARKNKENMDPSGPKWTHREASLAPRTESQVGIVDSDRRQKTKDRKIVFYSTKFYGFQILSYPSIFTNLIYGLLFEKKKRTRLVERFVSFRNFFHLRTSIIELICYTLQFNHLIYSNYSGLNKS